MQKWADYLISEVSYDSDHLISVAIRHKDSSNGISRGVPVDRLTVASDIKNGITYITIYSGNNSWKKGHDIQTFSIDGIPYLRIDGNKVKLDNLGDLPNVTSIDIQSLGIVPEDDDTNELKQIENIEQQIQNLETRSLSHLKQTPTSEQIFLDQNIEKSRKERLEEYENEYLNRIEEQKTLEEKTEEEIESERKINSPSIRGTLPKGYEIQSEPEDRIPSKQLAQIEQLEKQIQELESQPESTPEPEEEPGTPEQLAQIEQLEKQIQDLDSQLESIPEPTPSPRGSLPKESADELPQELDLAPEPITEPEEPTPEPEEPTPEPEEATPEQFEQVSSLQKQIDELDNLLSSKLENISQDSKFDSNLHKIENEITTNTSYEKENKIINKLDSQKEKLSDIEKKINDLGQDDTSTLVPQAYCVKCKTKRDIKNPEETKMKNGRTAVKGFCSVCSCKVYRIGKLN